MVYTDKYIEVLKTKFKDRIPGWITTSENPFFRKMSDLYASLSKKDRCLAINFHRHQTNYIKNRVKSVICVAICETEQEKQVIEVICNVNKELYEFVFTEEEFYKWIKDMKFDKIIMNPPYNGSLHLRIVESAVKKLKEKGQCINLSPIRWLQDPLAKDKHNSDYKKFEKSVMKHIKDLEVVDAKTANKVFNVSVGDLGIYTLTPECYDFDMNTFENPIVNKLIEFAKKDNVMNHSTKEGPKQNYTGIFGIITSHLGDLNNWVTANHEMWTKIRYNNTTKMISFSKEIEIENFFNSLLTKFFRYYAINVKKNQRTPWQFVPWMGDCINPRTGKKGYEGEWIDEDFYTYFGITEEEQKLIEKTMEKYK